MGDFEDSGNNEAAAVVRWRRYGHDRAYVRLVDGVEAGYRDLKSGDIHCSLPELVSVIRQATDHLLVTSPPTEATGRHAARENSARVPPDTESNGLIPPGKPARILGQDRDLALNAPGLQARSQAVAMKEAAPVRTFIARALGKKTDERSWRIGADGEEAVARRLRRLGADWHVIHAVPVGDNGADLDHLIIGAGGVFTINTKHHPDANIWVRGETFKVNGQNQRYVRNSRHEAGRAARLLSAASGFEVEVKAVIAVVGARGGFNVREQPGDGRVTIVTRRKLSDHILSLPTNLDRASIGRIYSVARHLATWHPATVEWSDF